MTSIYERVLLVVEDIMSFGAEQSDEASAGRAELLLELAKLVHEMAQDLEHAQANIATLMHQVEELLGDQAEGQGRR